MEEQYLPPIIAYSWRATKIDYLIQSGHDIIPIEVKSGPGTTLKSIQPTHKASADAVPAFLEGHPKTPYGIKFSTQNYSVHGKVHSYPLYAICAVFKKLRG